MWSGICSLGSKLTFLVEQMKLERSYLPLHHLRVQAAVRIATWYKQVRRAVIEQITVLVPLHSQFIPFSSPQELLRGRQTTMVLLIRKMKKAMAKHLPAVKEHIRGVVSMRIVAFLQVRISVGMCIWEGGLLTPSFLPIATLCERWMTGGPYPTLDHPGYSSGHDVLPSLPLCRRWTAPPWQQWR